LIKYLGSKRTLLPSLIEVVGALDGVRSVIDLFSGTSRVGHALKRHGYRVLANDHNAYAHALATCYVQADRDELLPDVERLVAELSRVPSGTPGWFTETFCVEARYFQPKNGARIEAIREAIAKKSLPPELEAVLLVSLMEAADRVDSTTGVQMAYLKQWAARANNDLELRVPDLVARAPAGKGEAHALDALEAARVLDADVAYLDPPYNQHSYLGNYHVWETLVRWDRPEAFGVARKRTDVRARVSPFNRRREALAALSAVVRAVRARHLVVSFSDEGYVSRPEMEALLHERGEVTTISHDFKRYVGAQIGIHNHLGEKVGKVSHLRNTEYVYVVSTELLRPQEQSLHAVGEGLVRGALDHARSGRRRRWRERGRGPGERCAKPSLHVANVHRTVLRLFLEQREPKRLEPVRYGLGPRWAIERRWLHEHLARHDLGRGSAVERTATLQELGEQAPHGVQIGARADPQRPALLGAHVLDRSADRVGLGERARVVGIADAREAEIEHFQGDRPVVVAGAEQVLGLEIAMHDVTRVRGAERVEHRQEHVGDLGERRQAPELGEPRRDRLAREPLHHDEHRARLIARELEHLDDVRVVEQGRGACLAAKAAHVVGVRRHPRTHDLDGHIGPPGEHASAVHLARATSPDPLDDLVLLAEHLPRVRPRGRRRLLLELLDLDERDLEEAVFVLGHRHMVAQPEATTNRNLLM
jgi:adenine-specific DNA-methyltransferase